ncbi:MAG: MBL fold metallo-hydrolase [Lachnospiraceae bacterium]|nr:MBL fold metallo-hydrolase [Lachnospiraceae bacterium]
MIKMPFYEIQDGIYEIDEFDCDNIFVIVGDDKALVVDTGCGIGDLRDTIKRITDKPYEVVLTHAHPDHIGGADLFDEIWLHPDDWWMLDKEICAKAPTLEYRKNYTEIIRNREKKFYDYDPDIDMHEWEKVPKLLPLKDRQVFDLGGRKVTAYHCPGHTPGEMVLIDDKTRTLLAGDACNCNLLVNSAWKDTPRESVKSMMEALKEIEKLSNLYDHMYNSHHDFRSFGCKLPLHVLTNAVKCMESVLNGTAEYVELPNPLSKNGGTKIFAICGKSMISFMEGNIKDECK